MRQGSWRTDARHARLSGSGVWSIADATFLQHEGRLLLSAATPVSLCWDGSTLTVGDMADGGACSVFLPDLTLRCTRAGALRASATGTLPIRLGLSGAMRSWAVLLHGAQAEEQGGIAHITPRPASRDLRGELTADAALLLADDQDPRTLQKLIDALNHRDWPVQMAAAWALGRRGDAAAVPSLLACLQREDPKLVYADIADVDVDWPGFMVGLGDALPLPGGDSPTAPRAAKRWRLRVELMESLGLLRDRRAVEVISRVLLELREPYPALAAAARALGRIGDPVALPAIEAGCAYYEACTHMAAHAAYRTLTGRPWQPPHEHR